MNTITEYQEALKMIVALPLAGVNAHLTTALIIAEGALKAQQCTTITMTQLVTLKAAVVHTGTYCDLLDSKITMNENENNREYFKELFSQCELDHTRAMAVITDLDKKLDSGE